MGGRRRRLAVIATASLVIVLDASGCSAAARARSTVKTANKSAAAKTTRTKSTPAKTSTPNTTQPATTTFAGTAAPTTTAQATPQSCRPIRIMPLGDSLTGFPDAYRGPLYRRLTSERLNVDFVGSVVWPPTGGGDPDSEGHGGFSIGPDASVDFQGKPSNLADNIDRWIPDAKPDIILLSIGANDIAAGGAKIAQAPAKLDMLVSRLSALAPSAVVVVGDIPPSIYNPTGGTSFKPLSDVAQRVGQASSTDRILYAPTLRRLLDTGFDPKSDTEDGEHFTAAGGVKYGDAWYPSVIEALTLLGPTC